MILNLDLHLRADPGGDHRALGRVAVEADGTTLAPHQRIALWANGRRVTAQITSIHRRGSHLPRVYADEIPAEEMV